MWPVTCSDCGIELKDEEVSRLPCGNCGSTKRTFHLSIKFTCNISAQMYNKATHKEYDPSYTGKHKESRVITTGDDFWRKSGKWMERHMEIDRLNKRFKEVIKDPKTGEIILCKDESLPGHTGHGSDKKK